MDEETERGLIRAGLDPRDVAAVIARALDEDLGGLPGRDVTVEATIPAESRARAHVVARAEGVLAGVPLLGVVLADVADRAAEPVPEVEVRSHDGDRVSRGDVIASLTGPTRVLLSGERTLLNLLGRLSGVATHTAAWVEALDGTGAQVLDTRKTTPGLRRLEKYAVRCGGGTNKRMGLYDVAMIKDNHKLAAGSITAAYRACRSAFPDVEVQVEVTTPAEAAEAVAAGSRFLLLDNMSTGAMREVVAATADSGAELEATGGLRLDTVAQVAATGVHYLSVGGLTHSSPALDIALDIVVDS